MKRRVMFVGAFSASAADGTLGGQTVGCRALLDSPISAHVDWQLIDSTQRSLPYPSLLERTAAAAWRVARVARGLARADAVLLFTPALPASLLEKGVMAWLARMARRRVVIAIRSEVPSRGAARRLLSAAVRPCHTVWVQSDAARQRLLQAVSGGAPHVAVIPNFLNAERVYDLPAAEPGTFNVLYAGWLSPWKGVPDLLEAFALLRGACPNARLVLCGDGPDLAALRARASALGVSGAVEFAGWVERARMAEVFAGASVLVLPSVSEGMPNVILEAMAAGLPVVATRVGGVPELVADGTTGFVVAVGDPEGIAARLLELARDANLRRTMGAAGRARLMERFIDTRWWGRVLRELGGREGTDVVQS